MPSSRTSKPTTTELPKRPQTPRRAEFRLYNGALTLFVNGRPTPPVIVEVGPQTSPESLAACATAGNHLYRLTEIDPGWTKAETLDAAPLEARIQDLLAADPAARFWLTAPVDAPLWWREANPAECVTYSLPAFQGVVETPPAASWASQRWRNEAGKALARLVRHVGQAEWGEHCLGYQIAAGTDGEWRLPNAERLPDTGPRLTERFRTFALEKYRRNTGLLRHAWFDTRAEFDTISCPNAYERRKANLGVFRNPTRSRRLLDYYECLADAQNTAALHFCQVVKEATDGQALVGLSYAPLYGTETLPEDGHAFPEPVLDSPLVDFFANLGPQDGSAYLRAIPGALQLRSKFLFHIPHAEQPPDQAAALAQSANAGVILPAATPPDSLRTLTQQAERNLSLPAKTRKPASELAFIVDPANLLYVNPADGWLNTAHLTEQVRALAQLDAPFDVYLLSDLFHPRLPDYKVFLFANLFYLSEAERRRIDARVKRSEQTAAWLWAPGVIGEEGIDATLGQRLCGQKMRIEANAIALRVRLVEAGHPLTRGHHLGTTYGADRPVTPIVTLTDRAATRLGANTAHKTAFATLKFPTWTSVVYGAAPVPLTLLRNLLRTAGKLTTEVTEEHRGER